MCRIRPKSFINNRALLETARLAQSYKWVHVSSCSQMKYRQRCTCWGVARQVRACAPMMAHLLGESRTSPSLLGWRRPRTTFCPTSATRSGRRGALFLFFHAGCLVADVLLTSTSGVGAGIGSRRFAVTRLRYGFLQWCGTGASMAAFAAVSSVPTVGGFGAASFAGSVALVSSGCVARVACL